MIKSLPVFKENLFILISGYQLRTIGALLKCLDRRRVGVELEDSSVGVPILQILTYKLYAIYVFFAVTSNICINWLECTVLALLILELGYKVKEEDITLQSRFIVLYSKLVPMS